MIGEDKVVGKGLISHMEIIETVYYVPDDQINL